MIKGMELGVLAAAAGFGCWLSAAAQQVVPANLPQAPSAVRRPLQLAGGVVVEPEQPVLRRLTLDEAIQNAMNNNAAVRISAEQEEYIRGQQLTALQNLLPGLCATAYARAQEIDLAAMGFKPGSIKAPAGGGAGGFNPASIRNIVKVNTASAQLSLQQTLFSSTALFLYRATERAREASNWSTQNNRGGAVLEVGGLYLRALADRAMVRNAAALVAEDRVVFEHARALRDAGVGINLDVLRAQVDLQNEEEQLVEAENAEAKDKIMLNRVMGQPAGQALELVDGIPYADFNADSSDAAIRDALAIAYVRRKDLRGLEAQLAVAHETQLALKYERLPTVAFGGYYGVLGEIGGLFHGVFTAQGEVSIPVFQEAELRGQREVGAAQERGLEQQIEGTRAQIEADIRSSLLDVQTQAELVKVARSNVELAGQALDDATTRFTAGVDDNLPVARAQAALVGAQARVVQAEFNYNYAKLNLARNTGVVGTQYKQYLGQ